MRTTGLAGLPSLNSEVDSELERVLSLIEREAKELKDEFEEREAIDTLVPNNKIDEDYDDALESIQNTFR